jgi:hypothetical protein
LMNMVTSSFRLRSATAADPPAPGNADHTPQGALNPS